MSKAATSLLVFGIYVIVTGLVFLLAPNLPLGLLGVPATTEPWIRVMAVVLLIVAYYYIQAARNEMTGFIRLTVHGRAAALVFFVALVALGLAHPTLIMFGVIDVLGAIWTALALRSDAG